MRSFIAIDSHHPFPLQNLPYGVFSTSERSARVGVALGDYIVDVAALTEAGLLASIVGDNVFASPSLNRFMALGYDVWRAVRHRLQQLLSEEEATLRDDDDLRRLVFVPQAEATMHLPIDIGDYTDFYASKDHAFNVGTMFRGPENALMPNWLHVPIGYHGRASSIVVSGTNVVRPNGQRKAPQDEAPTFGPSRQLDYELELGFVIGTGNPLGTPIPIEQAEQHIFGLVLVNDWSARDIQAWEYQPLGPFLGKSFATTIAPWIVPLDAVAPFRVAGPVQEPTPLPYLQEDGANALNIELAVDVTTATGEEARLTTSNARHLYWSIAQQLAHHTSNGCNLRTGDLLASGTISGPEKTSRGCLLELTWRGTEPVQLPSGATRVWLEDGDQLTMSGYCQGDGYRIGFGTVTGQVLPAVPFVTKEEVK